MGEYNSGEGVDSDQEAVAPEMTERVLAAVEPIASNQPPRVVADRPRLERGYKEKVMTGSKRERRRLRRLERENQKHAARRGAAMALA
jgi:hypothetical protein